jgi:hypothetical protein
MYNVFYKKNFTDVIGSKFYRLDIFKKINLKENKLDWDFELKNRLISGPYKILEVFTNYKPRFTRYGTVKYYHIFPAVYEIIKFKLLNIILR